MGGTKIVGVISSGPMPSQAALDAAIALQKPVVDVFYAVPVGQRADVLISLIASWCLSYDDPEAAFHALGNEASNTINNALLQAQEPKQ